MSDREARKPLLIFGDGMQGEVENFQRGITSDEGLKMVRIEFRPTEEFMRFYGLQNDDFTNPDRMTFVVDFPEVYIEILSEGDPEHQCIVVYCDFYGRDTRMTDKHMELINANKMLQKENTALRYQVAKLYYDLQTANKSYGEYAKYQLEDVFGPIIKKVRGNIQESSPDMGEE